MPRRHRQGPGARRRDAQEVQVALVDVPILGRGVFQLDTFQSGLLLTRFLLGVPVGALVGGWLGGILGQRTVAFGGLVLAACGSSSKSSSTRSPPPGSTP